MRRARTWSNHSDGLAPHCSSAQEAMLQAAAAQAARQALAVSTSQVTALQSQLHHLQQQYDDATEACEELTAERELLDARLTDMQENSKAIVETLQKRYISVVAERLACEKRISQLQMGMSLMEGERDAALASATAGVAAAAAAAAQSAIAACAAAAASGGSGLPASLTMGLLHHVGGGSGPPTLQPTPHPRPLQPTKSGMERATANVSMITSDHRMQVGNPAVRSANVSLSSYGGSGDFSDAMGTPPMNARTAALTRKGHRLSSTINMPFQFPSNHAAAATQGQASTNRDGTAGSPADSSGSSTLHHTINTLNHVPKLSLHTGSGPDFASGLPHAQQDPPTPSAFTGGANSVSRAQNGISLSGGSFSSSPQNGTHSGPASPRRGFRSSAAPDQSNASGSRNDHTSFSSPTRATDGPPVSSSARVGGAQRSGMGAQPLGAAEGGRSSAQGLHPEASEEATYHARATSAASDFVEQQYALVDGASSWEGASAKPAAGKAGKRRPSNSPLPSSSKMVRLMPLHRNTATK